MTGELPRRVRPAATLGENPTGFTVEYQRIATCPAKVEIIACLRINRLSRRRWTRRFFALISKLGDGSYWVACCGVLLALQGPASVPLIGQMAVTGAAGVLVYRQLKLRLVRERPFIANGAIECGTAPLDRYSFQSGHTLHAVSFTIMLGTIEPLLLVPALPFAVLVAISRVVLGLHYPSDVLVGALLGSAIGSTSVAFL